MQGQLVADTTSKDISEVLSRRLPSDEKLRVKEEACSHHSAFRVHVDYIVNYIFCILDALVTRISLTRDRLSLRVSWFLEIRNDSPFESKPTNPELLFPCPHCSRARQLGII